MQRVHEVSGNTEKDRRRKKLERDRGFKKRGKKHGKEKRPKHIFIDRDEKLDFGWN
jgi:hypothetical protein